MNNFRDIWWDSPDWPNLPDHAFFSLYDILFLVSRKTM